MTLESVSSSDLLSPIDNKGESFIYSMAKLGIILGVFFGAMKILEEYLGPSQAYYSPNDYNDQSDDSDSGLTDRVTIPATQVTIPEEVQVALQIETTEVLLEAAEKEVEEEEKTPIYVIGAEDAVDHVNRMIGY